MTLFPHIVEHVSQARSLVKWLLLSIPLGIAVGSACAVFLWSLDAATQLRFQYPWLLYLLPLAGAGIGWVYATYGKSVERGNNLIFDEIHQPGGGVPWRMAPLILLSTVVTHLFGGSAGREGTAVQMGGSFASWLSRRIPWLHAEDRSGLLMAGVAAGFGGVFGTPVAGMIFAMEVLTIGRMQFSAALPCLVASLISDQTCLAWGIHHTHYSIHSLVPAGTGGHLAPLVPWMIFCTFIAGPLFGLAGRLFAWLTHLFSSFFHKRVRNPAIRPVYGGCILIGLVGLMGTREYLGLGVTSPDPHAVTIVRSFEPGGADPLSWFWKTLYTSITLGSGFKGGEVTPLFFIGSTLGNQLGTLFHVPVDLFAALGFVAVFAGATNTPIACTVMAVELFGGEYVVYFMIACQLAYLFSGYPGIYTAQRVGIVKYPRPQRKDSHETLST